MKIKHQLLGTAIASAATFAVAAPSFAITSFIGNAPINFIDPADGQIRFQTSTISPTQSKAVSFTTPASAEPEELELVGVELLLSGLDAGEASVTIREDDNADLDEATIAATLDNISPTPSNPLNTFTFSSSTSFSFAPSTTYWLLVEGNTGGFSWISPVTANNETPTGIASFGEYQFTNDGGNTYSSSGQFNTFEILTNEPAATAVPFDFSATPGLLVIGGLWGANKLRRRKNSAKILKD